MKYIRFIHLFIYVILFPTLCSAQERSYELYEQYSSSQTYDFVARDFVRMLPGFSYQATGTPSFTARINSGLIVPVSYEPPVNPDIRVIDTKLSVGSTPCIIDVNSIGAASCAIPIQVPNGTNGMLPQLSINYNSNMGHGLLGMGWGLSGLSIISRTSKDIFHDKKVEGINFEDDPFELDGNRLIFIVNNTVGATFSEYRTESNTFSRIISYGSHQKPASPNPDKFLVYTKDGLIMEYGFTDDSKIEAQNSNTVLYWCLNKITDLNGNYLTITYEEDNETGSFRPSKIYYTGNSNANVTPDHEIRFFYESDAVPSNAYIQGSLVSQNQVLYKIATYTGGQLVKQYYFHYTLDFYTHLVEVIEEGLDGSSLNSTIIQWGNKSTAVSKGTQINFANYANPDHTPATPLFVIGDFDGDGLSDYYTYPKKDIYNDNDQWSLFLNNRYGNSFTLTNNGAIKSTNNANIKIVQKTPLIGLSQFDYNADGKEDLLFYENSGSGDNTVSIFPAHFDDNFNLIREYRNRSGGDFRYMFTSMGDFNGDKVSDQIIIYPNTSHTEFRFYNNNPVTIEGSDYVNLYNHQIHEGDFTGEGKNDILFVESGKGSFIMQYEGAPYVDGSFQVKQTNVLTHYYDNMLMGDFNGDGKTDILGNFKGSSSWQVELFNGQKFQTQGQPLIWAQYDSLFENSSNFYVADINGDGKSDVLQFILAKELVNDGLGSNKSKIPEDPIKQPIYNYTYQVVLHLSNGNGFMDEKSNLKVLNNISSSLNLKMISYLYFGDFNGDEGDDLLLYTDLDKQAEIYYFHPFNRSQKVFSITDGFNVKTTFTYKNLTEPNFYSRKSIETYPLKNFNTPYDAVSSLKRDNGQGGVWERTYQYAGGIEHLQGKGFLGFEEVKVQDLQSQIEVTMENMINHTYYFLQPSSSSSLSLQNSQPVTSVSYIQDIKTYSSDYPNIVFPYTKTQVTVNNLKGTTTTQNNTYDNYGNLTASITDFGSASSVETNNTFGGFGNWWCPASRLLQSTVKLKREGKPDYSRTVSYNYSGNNGARGLIDYITTDPDKSLSTTSTFEYDVFGNNTKTTTSAAGLTSQISSVNYDIKGQNVISRQNSLNHIENYTYDPRSKWLTSVTDPNGLTVQFLYDGFGRKVHTILPTNKIITESWTWQTPGTAPAYTLYSHTTTAENKPTNVDYFDRLGRQLRSQTQGYDGTMIYSDYQFNAKGQLQQQSRPYYPSDGSPWNTTYSYDSYNRLIQVSNPANEIDYIYDNLKTTVLKKPSATNNTGSSVIQSVITETDPQGLVVSVTDPKGQLTIYDYTSSGKVSSIKTPGLSEMTVSYDAYDRQQTLVDPDAGTINYSYNAFGQLTSQTDARGNSYIMQYDQLGRVLSKLGPDGTYSYLYDSGNKALGKISKVTGPQGDQRFTYDDQGRMNTQIETIDQIEYKTEYSYDEFDNLVSHQYPGGFSVSNQYNQYGYLQTVSRADNNQIIWEGGKQNAWGQWQTYYHGASGNATQIATTTKTYDNNGFPLTWNVQSKSTSNASVNWGFAYQFDPTTGNLLSRMDSKRGLQEQFQYDNLDRLLSASPAYKPFQNSSNISPMPISVAYDAMGNIQSKTGVGDFEYGEDSGPNAITKAKNFSSSIPTLTQQVTYTGFGKIKTIKEGPDDDYHNMVFTYGADQERSKVQLYHNNTELLTKFYASGYEKEVNSVSGTSRALNYIMGGDGLTAIFVEDASGGKLYNIHRDYQGSMMLMTDDKGKQVEEYSFDSWGRRRNPDTWDYAGLPTERLFDRGYTGHEHHDIFGLINMNGRLYDPVLGRMLSPDNYVQNPGFSQNYNRYTYAFNNPLKFTDPTGELNRPSRSNQAAGSNSQMSSSELEYRLADIGNFKLESSLGGIEVGGLSPQFSDWGEYNASVQSYYQDHRASIDGYVARTSYAPQYYIHSYQKDENGNKIDVYNYITTRAPIFRSHSSGNNPHEATISCYREASCLSDRLGAIRDANTGGGSDWMSKTQTGLGAVDVGWGAKEELINYAAKSSSAINEMGYVKAVKVASKGLFAAQAVLSGVNVYNAWDANNSNKWGVTGKAGLDVTIGYISLVGGPVGWGVGAVYFVGDAAGWWGNWGEATPSSPLNINKQ